MTIRLPLVLGADGLPQQLQSGDSLTVPTFGVSILSTTNHESSAALVIGTPVYVDAAAGVKRAKADSKSTSGVVGLWYDTTTAASATGYMQTDDMFTATTTQWDTICGTTGGLTAGTVYFLDPTTAGKLTSTPPTTVGHCVVPVMRALSTTQAVLLLPALPVLL